MYTNTIFNDANRFTGLNSTAFSSNPSFNPAVANPFSWYNNNFHATSPVNASVNSTWGAASSNPFLAQSLGLPVTAAWVNSAYAKQASTDLSNYIWSIPQTTVNGEKIAATNNLGQTIVAQVIKDAYGTKLITEFGVYSIASYLSSNPYSLSANPLNSLGSSTIVTLVAQNVFGG